MWRKFNSYITSLRQAKVFKLYGCNVETYYFVILALLSIYVKKKRKRKRKTRTIWYRRQN